MKAIVSLDGIWSFLQSLSLDNNNKQWLADKLLADIHKDKAAKEEQDDIRFQNLAGCWADCPEMENIETMIRESRTNGATRHILSLDGEGCLD